MKLTVIHFFDGISADTLGRGRGEVMGMERDAVWTVE
jgi:hypothetical protein